MTGVQTCALPISCLGACSGGSRLDVVAPAAKITRYSAWCLEEGSAGHKYMARPTGWARREPNQHTDVCGKRRLSRHKQCFKCLTNTRITRRDTSTSLSPVTSPYKSRSLRFWSYNRAEGVLRPKFRDTHRSSTCIYLYGFGRLGQRSGGNLYSLQ